MPNLDLRPGEFEVALNDLPDYTNTVSELGPASSPRHHKESPVSTERLEDRLKVMLVERLMLKIKAEEIADEDDLILKWGLESVQLMEIVIGLEEVFGLQLGDDEFSVRKFRTVKNIAEVVRGKMPGA